MLEPRAGRAEAEACGGASAPNEGAAEAGVDELRSPPERRDPAQPRRRASLRMYVHGGLAGALAFAGLALSTP